MKKRIQNVSKPKMQAYSPCSFSDKLEITGHTKKVQFLGLPQIPLEVSSSIDHIEV